MRTFANLFLFFFVVDGLLSAVDDLLAITLGIEGLAPLRNLNALATLLLAVPMFFSLGFDRRLPKRVFLPLLAFLLWSTAGCWPLTGLLPLEHLSLLASLLQLLLGVLVLAYLRLRGGSLQLTHEDFSATPFSLTHTLGYFALTLLCLPLVGVYLAVATFSHQIETQTAGFMRIGLDGLYMKERTYRLDEKQVRLSGMIHIGEQSYYQQLADSIESEKTLILAEGVSDKQGLLTSRFDYGNLGSALGISTQQELNFDARQVDLEEIDHMAWEDKEITLPHITVADVDLSSFQPLTIEFLNQLGQLLTGHGSFKENFTAYNSWLEKNMTPDLYDTIMGDILDKRNTTVIGHLKRALASYQTVVVPWGAMHMPAIESALLEQGFSRSEEQERLSLAYSSIPFEDLLQRLTTETANQN